MYGKVHKKVIFFSSVFLFFLVVVEAAMVIVVWVVGLVFGTLRYVVQVTRVSDLGE